MDILDDTTVSKLSAKVFLFLKIHPTVIICLWSVWKSVFSCM